MKKCLRYSWIFAAAICAIGLSILARSITHHFSNNRIISPLSLHPDWERENPSEVEEILSQPFHFFAHGGQSWSFLSEDGKWIVKFFDFRPTWHDLGKTLHLPETLCPKLTEKQIRRREGPPAGYALAAKNFRNECGLIGVFLNGKHSGVHNFVFSDMIHCSHQIDLASTSFVIQKKAETLPDRLTRLLKNGETGEASKALSQALTLIAARSAAGIADGDNTQLHYNLGFVGEEPIYIDAGTFIESPELRVVANIEAEVLRAADVLLAKISEEHIAR